MQNAAAPSTDTFILTKIHPRACQYNLIEYAHRDKLPSSIKCMQADKMDEVTLRQGLSLFEPGVQFAQMETPVSEELRAFSRKILKYRPERDGNIDFRKAATDRSGSLEEKVQKSLTEYFNSNVPQGFLRENRVLFDAWLEMQIVGVRIAETMFPHLPLRVMIRRNTANMHTKNFIGLHRDSCSLSSSFGEQQSSYYLNFSQGEIGSVSPDDRDCFSDRGRLLFTTLNPRMCVAKPFTWILMPTEEHPSGGSWHSIPPQTMSMPVSYGTPVREPEYSEDFARETLTVEIPYLPAYIS